MSDPARAPLDSSPADEGHSRRFLEELSDAAYQADTAGRLTYVNAASQQLTGLPVEEVIGRSFLPLFVPESRAVATDVYRRTLAGESPEYELTFTTGRTCQFHNRPLRDADGKIIGVIGVARDVTEHRRIEEELRRHRQELEERVEQRTAEFQQANQRLREELAERKRGERALRESEHRYRSLFENIPTGVYRTTPDGRIEAANPALVKMLGFSSFQQLATRNLEEDGFEPGYHRREFRKQIERDGVLSLDVSAWRKRDGTLLHVREHARAVRDEQGQVVCYEGTVEDVTERRWMAELLRSQRDLGVALTTATNLDQALRHVLRAALEMEGIDCGGIYLVDQASGEPRLAAHQNLSVEFVASTAVLGPDTPQARLIRQGEPLYWRKSDFAVTEELLLHEGISSLAIIPVLHDGQAIASLNFCSQKQEDIPLGVRHALESIAARLGSVIARFRAEDALRESEELFRTLAETTPTGIVIVGQDRLVYANPAMARIVGRTTEELLRTDFLEHIHPEMREEVRYRVGAHLRGEPVPSRYELRAIDKQGNTRWLDFSATLIKHRGEWVALGAAVDITDRKQSEDAARRHLEQLAHVSRVSTIGEMVSGLAHELTQPLSAILYYARGCATRLGSGAWGPGEATETLGKISVQAERAAEFIRHLKAFIRKAHPHREPADLNEVVRDTLRFAVSEAQQSNVTVRFEPRQDLPGVMIDKIQIEQVILNLLRNGIEAMRAVPLGQRELLIRTMADAGRTVTLSVRDTGPGLAADTPERVFDAFFTTKPGGTGLGLSISRTIIQDTHEGELWVRPGPARGTVFGFTLPARGSSDAGQ